MIFLMKFYDIFMKIYDFFMKNMIFYDFLWFFLKKIIKKIKKKRKKHKLFSGKKQIINFIIKNYIFS